MDATAIGVLRRLEEVEGLIQRRTGGCIRDLRIEVYDDRIVLCGRTSTYYAKQLAQQAAKEAKDLAAWGRLDNEIEVL